MPPRKLARSQPPISAPADEVRTIPTVPIAFPINRYRVLFSDGDIVDFVAYADHSGIRGEMLDAHFGKRPKTDNTSRIEGIAHLGVMYTHIPNTNWPDPEKKS